MFISSLGTKSKFLAGAVLILLAVYCAITLFQHEEIEEEPSVEFSLSPAQYANKPNHFDRHIVVSNGPECAAIGL